MIIKRIKYLTVIFLAITVATACNKSELPPPSRNIVYNGFGEISYVGDDGYFEITRDDRALLKVVEYNGSKEVSPGERVYFKYQILTSDKYERSSRTAHDQEVYEIKIIVFNDIYSAPLLRKSFLQEDAPHRDDSIGHDLVMVTSAAFSGDYINIGIEYFRVPDGKPHMINLVWDDTRHPLDSVYLELRHNAMGELSTEGADIVAETGLLSFKLSDLIPPERESIKVKLKSNMTRKDGVGEYIEEDTYYTGTFNPHIGTKSFIVGNEFNQPGDRNHDMNFVR